MKGVSRMFSMTEWPVIEIYLSEPRAGAGSNAYPKRGEDALYTLIMTDQSPK